MTSEGKSALLPANADRRRLQLQQGLMNFRLQNFQLYKKSSLGPLGNSLFCFRRFSMFPSANTEILGKQNYCKKKNA